MPRRNRSTRRSRPTPQARPEPTPALDTDLLARGLVDRKLASIHILEPTKGPYRSENR